MKKMLKNQQYFLEPVPLLLHSFSHDFVVVQPGGDVQGECVVSYSQIKKRAIYANIINRLCATKANRLFTVVCENCDVTPS